MSKFTADVSYRDGSTQSFNIDKSQATYLQDQLEVIENNCFIWIRSVDGDSTFINLSDVVQIVIVND